MTVIVAYVSDAGAVMASDSQATEEDDTVSEMDKIWTGGGLLFGYSGDVSVRDSIQDNLEKRLLQSPIGDVEVNVAKSTIRAYLRPVLQEAYDNLVVPHGEDPADSIGGSLLVIGFDGQKHWLLEVDRRNKVYDYTEDGFHAIGSGSRGARAGRGLLNHYRRPGYEVRHLRLLAYRTVDMCIRVLGGRFGIGPPVQLWQSQDQGFNRVVGSEYEAVKVGVQQWIELERESLEGVFVLEQEIATPETQIPRSLEPPE